MTKFPTKVCPLCKEIKSLSEYYKKENGRYPHGYCIPCAREVALARYKRISYKSRERKQAAVLAAGDRCADCLQSFPLCVYDFHHLDPETKDSRLNQMWWSASNKRLQDELDKCILLCSNCHRIRHYDTT